MVRKHYQKKLGQKPLSFGNEMLFFEILSLFSAKKQKMPKSAKRSARIAKVPFIKSAQNFFLHQIGTKKIQICAHSALHFYNLICPKYIGPFLKRKGLLTQILLIMLPYHLYSILRKNSMPTWAFTGPLLGLSVLSSIYLGIPSRNFKARLGYQDMLQN